MGPEPEQGEASSLFLLIQHILLTTRRLLLNWPRLGQSQRIWWVGGGQGKGCPTAAKFREEKEGRDGPYHDTKQHGSPDDPPDFLVPVRSPAPTAKR